MVTGNRAVIIGAGRGQRLMPTTADGPKCFAEVQGRRLLDWTIEALTEGGADDICFIGGYLIEAVESHYPALTLRHNQDWANNNILCSLMCAEDLMDRPFVACYSDILFSADIVRRLFTRATSSSASTRTGASTTATAPSTRRTTPRR
ncbi:MAG: NTP transferase domain-containing protein [Geminicoccaceae bacterium]